MHPGSDVDVGGAEVGERMASLSEDGLELSQQLVLEQSHSLATTMCNCRLTVPGKGKGVEAGEGGTGGWGVMEGGKWGKGGKRGTG